MNPVFEHYMTEQAQQALNVFRTFNKEDFIDEFIDPEHSLIEEAFNDVEALLNYSTVKLEGELKASVLRTAKDLISAFSTMTRQSIGLTLAFRKEQNYAGNFLKELTKHSAKRLETDIARMKNKHTGVDVDKLTKDINDPNVKSIDITDY